MTADAQVFVPRQPTYQMKKAGALHLIAMRSYDATDDYRAEEVYRVMLAAVKERDAKHG